jgi:DNA/RNA endonuclease YhcR with UshA esterase domain
VVRVTAAVVEVGRNGTKGPYRLTLADGTGSLPLQAWESVFVQIPEKDSLTGRAVTVRARVNLYRAELVQLMLDQPFDLAFTDHPDAAAWVARGAADRGERSGLQQPRSTGGTCLEGTVLSAETMGRGKGLLVTLDGDDRQVVLWKATLDGRPAWKDVLAAGRRVRACGDAGEYKGKAQVVVSTRGSVTALDQGR